MPQPAAISPRFFPPNRLLPLLPQALRVQRPEPNTPPLVDYHLDPPLLPVLDLVDFIPLRPRHPLTFAVERGLVECRDLGRETLAEGGEGADG